MIGCSIHSLRNACEVWEKCAVLAAPYTASFNARAPTHVGVLEAGATPSGIRDLIGNVWEWTSSPMTAYPGATPLADSLANYRVIRGGAFTTPDEIATTWLRGYNRPSTAPEALEFTGFRCAK